MKSYYMRSFSYLLGYFGGLSLLYAQNAIPAASGAPAGVPGEDARPRQPWVSEGVRPLITQHAFESGKPGMQVVEKGPHHRVWQWSETLSHEGMETEEVLHGYTELASGLHYWDEGAGRYRDAVARIVPHPQGAVALEGQQQVIFAGNLNRRGAVDILGPDGVRLQGSVLGLVYFDESTGEEVFLATLKSSRGELIGENQLIYRDAFDDLKADILYTYRISGLEQDIILRESPPSPAAFGLNNATTRLESLTEWYDTPQPTKHLQTIAKGRPQEQGAQTDLVDEDLSFGAIRMVPGKVFWQDDGQPRAERHVGPDAELEHPVVKKWRVIGGRTVLYESVA